MNGFIIAYNRQLAKNGVQDFAFYRECFEKMDMDFSKDMFVKYDRLRSKKRKRNVMF